MRKTLDEILLKAKESHTTKAMIKSIDEDISAENLPGDAEDIFDANIAIGYQKQLRGSELVIYGITRLKETYQGMTEFYNQHK